MNRTAAVSRLALFAALLPASFLAGLLSGCAVDDPYAADRAMLEATPEVTRVHGQVALEVLVDYYGIRDAGAVVHWTDKPIVLADGEPVQGVTLGCESWVYWVSPHPAIDPLATSPVFAFTAMSHEVAHCALHALYGDPDSAHTRADWWLAGGVVEGARDALAAAGF